MKKKLALLSSALIFASVAQVANAGTGTIDIEGGVSDTTCTVTVNNTTGGNATVVLPVVRPGALDAPGKTAGRAFLNFELTGCASAATLASTARVYFLASQDINSAGRLSNTTTTNGVQNVDIEVLNSDLSSINLTNTSPQHTTVANITGTSGTAKASIRHYVQYYATGQATPGRLTANLEYNIEYQ